MMRVLKVRFHEEHEDGRERCEFVLNLVGTDLIIHQTFVKNVEWPWENIADEGRWDFLGYCAGRTYIVTVTRRKISKDKIVNNVGEFIALIEQEQHGQHD
jgi:hypothetical protein